MTSSILPVIMAGGSGTRLWPLSRELFPKQFIALEAEQSMLQVTLTRLAGLPVSLPLVICNENHRFLAAEQLRQLAPPQVVVGHRFEGHRERGQRGLRGALHGAVGDATVSCTEGLTTAATAFGSSQ